MQHGIFVIEVTSSDIKRKAFLGRMMVFLLYVYLLFQLEGLSTAF